MRTLTRFLAAAVVATATLRGDEPRPPIAVIPAPARVTPGDGSFSIDTCTAITADPALTPIRSYLRSWLHFSIVGECSVEPPRIALRLAPSLSNSLGAEGYRLVVTPKSVSIQAATPAGVFYGVQTLRQLLPPDCERRNGSGAIVTGGCPVPVVSIEDTPRFSWRGAHLDVSRHFMPVAFVKKWIDLLALHKLNRFHWHLTDDQGWRIEIKKYPKLTEVGAWRKETIVGRESTGPNAKYDGTRYGGFYTQAEVRDVVAYARERFITVVPEIEMPGHSQEVVAAYPEHGSTTAAAETRTHWGVSQFLLRPDDATVTFMQDVLTEVLELFPSPWIHIGGDEADKTQWKASPEIQARIKTLGLKDEHELQSWFIRKMDAFLTSKKRRLIGWDEILEGGLAENATVMSWRGIKGAVDAAKAGHDAVLTPTDFTYFDYYQSGDRAKEPLNIGGNLPLEKVFGWEPIPPELTAAEQKHILGVQGQLWTEYLDGPKAVEYNAFPRLTALAEVAWTPAPKHSLEDFRTRLFTHLVRLQFLGVNYRPLDPQK